MVTFYPYSYYSIMEIHKYTLMKRDKYKTVAADAPETREEFECCICMQTMPRMVGCQTECQHLFCAPCLDRWRELSDLCPLCKTNYNEVWHLLCRRRAPR